ncbi:hypothetical protein Peur_061854 [Populus x canadensis]
MAELIKKPLTRTDLEYRLAYRTQNLWAFPLLSEGRTSIRFHARDALGKVWNLKLSTRTQGHPKPAITGEWLSLVKEKGLRVGDRIVLTREVDEDDIVSYEIRTERKIFNVWVPVKEGTYLCLLAELAAKKGKHQGQNVKIHTPTFAGCLDSCI